MEREDKDGSISEEADQRFHCIIAEAAGNSALASVVRWLWALRNRSVISTYFHQRVREKGVHPSIEEHVDIFNAVKARDPDAARQAMMTHISNAIEADYKVTN
jgi:DNA-binding FadR family transcriptional regulator